MENKGLKIVGAVIAGLVIGAGVGYALQPEPVVVTKEVLKSVEVIKEVPVNVTVEKLVDNGKLAMLTQYLEDKELYADQAEVILEVESDYAAKDLAEKEARSEAFHLLENKGLFADEKDLKFLSFDSDFDELNSSKANYDSNEYEYVFKAKVRDVRKEENKKVLLHVSVDEGVADLFNATLQ